MSTKWISNGLALNRKDSKFASSSNPPPKLENILSLPFSEIMVLSL